MWRGAEQGRSRRAPGQRSVLVLPGGEGSAGRSRCDLGFYRCHKASAIIHSYYHEVLLLDTFPTAPFLVVLGMLLLSLANRETCG